MSAMNFSARYKLFKKRKTCIQVLLLLSVHVELRSLCFFNFQGKFILFMPPPPSFIIILFNVILAEKKNEKICF